MAGTPLSQLTPAMLAQLSSATPAQWAGTTNSVASAEGNIDTTTPGSVNGFIQQYAPAVSQGYDNSSQAPTTGNLTGYSTSANGNIYSYDTSGKLTGVTKQDDNGGLLGTFMGTVLSLALPEFAPLIMGGATLATGGSIQDALKAGALTYGGQQLMGTMGANGPSDIGVSQTQAPLDSSFDQYLSPTGATSYPVAPQTPFSGTSILDPVTGAPTTAATDYSLASQAPVNGMGGAQGIQSNPNANLADMGGGQGITNATSANLTDMGGGQGLTTAAAGGGTLGQTGVNTGGSVLDTNPLTGQTLGTALNTLNTGVTPDATGLGTTLANTTTGANPAATAATAAGAGVLGTGLTAAQVAALGTGVTGLVTGANTNSAISAAQAAQNAAAAKSAGTLGDIYNTQMGSLAPYQATGQAGLTDINANMPYFQHQFDTSDLNSNLAPNYAFQLGQGQQANQRAANVGGGALSGNTLTGLNRYTQDYAGNAYQQAFNNYNNQRNNIYSTLSNIAGIGSTANNSAIGAGNTYGTNLTNLNTGLAAAQASATVGQAQNTSNTISNLGNAATLAALLGQKNPVA